MRGGGGLRSEVLFGLALVMGLGSLTLTSVFASHQEAGLRRVLGRALLAEAHRPEPRTDRLFADTDWYVLARDGTFRPRGAVSGPADAETRSLAEEVRGAGRALLRTGGPADPIRFGAPGPGGSVSVGRLPRRASVQLRLVPLAVAGGVALANVLVFTGFGAFLLRRRVVEPLEGLAAVARELGEGHFDVTAREEGTREFALVARGFNEMAAGIACRSEALEKAVVELRGANEELRLTRDHLDRSERLAALGQLAAGVAHEVGNPIGAILAFVELAARDPGVSSETRGHLHRAGEEGDRVRRILRQLLDFARPAPMVPAPLDLGAAAESARDLVAAQRRYASVQTEIERHPGAPLGHADQGAVSQILLNLLLNAAEAVLENGGGRIHIDVAAGTLRRRAGDEPAAGAGAADRSHPEAVTCRIADDGAGVPDEIRERIFAPFFTTRDPGRGTGLGLPNALRLTEELEGRLELAEAPEGFRTCFELTLPATPKVGGPSVSARRP